MLCLEIAWSYLVSRRRSMLFSLVGIIFGVAFFVITQAQTSGFEQFFIRTILGTNGAIRISDRYQDTFGTVESVSDEGRTKFIFHTKEDARYHKGIQQPSSVRSALDAFPEIIGISEILEGVGALDTGSRNKTVHVHGIRWEDHSSVSDLGKHILQGAGYGFSADQMGFLLGSRIAQELNLQLGDRVTLTGGVRTLNLKVAGVFETGVSQIDKNRIYMHLSMARSFLGQPFGGSVFQVGLSEPDIAPQLSAQIQSTLNHRAVSWQEREKVWLDVFKALKFSSAITVSSIILLSGLGMFNVFAVMVFEKTRDIAILRALGFSPQNISAVFLWQGFIILIWGVLLGALLGALTTWVISRVPLRIRGIFSTDSFVVNWDGAHYLWAAMISFFVVSIACYIPARRAARVQPAKIIRETV